MRRTFVCAIAILTGTACSTITVSKVDRCTVQRTKTWAGSVRDEIVFCDREAPKWSDDRALRLTQECLYEADLHRRDALILSARVGHPNASTLPEEDAFSRCYPDTVKTVQAENDALKERLKREEETRTQFDGQRDKFETALNGQREKFETALDGQREKMESAIDSQRSKLDSELASQRNKMDEQRAALEARMEGQHEKIETALVSQHGQLDAALVGQNGQLQKTLSKALERPVNAVAEAHATSDSDVKHASDSKELAHFDYASGPAPAPVATPVVQHRVHHVKKNTKDCETPSRLKAQQTPAVPMSTPN